MRLLVTERDPLVQQLLGRQAAELGITVVFARDRDEALDAIADRPVDCLVLDAESTLEDEDQPRPWWWSELRVPVLVYSSCQRWRHVAELAGAEVDGFVSRPFTTAALLDEARRACHRRASA